ncbi:elongation factor P, partial [Patescibacteria group bacterium]|nr:elongation factor P [Patescibacteria group bacterium]
MISLGQLKQGNVIMRGNDPYLVVECAHHKMGRGGAVLKTKLKNIKNGNVIENTFQGNDKIELANLSRKRAQFLYADDTGAHFMDENYEQFFIDKKIAQDALQYLKDGQQVDVQYLDATPINIHLPPKVDLEVKEAPPAVKGDTANNPSKTIVLE